jgi:hypothetical protein
MKTIVAALALLWAVSPVLAEEAKPVDCARAEQLLAKPFSSWNDAYAYYKKFHGLCSDGALAESLSARFTRLLSNRWSRMPELNRLAHSDPAFLEWVLLGVYYNPEETEVNASNTACRLLKRLQSCRAAEKVLCGRLATRVGPSRQYVAACEA